MKNILKDFKVVLKEASDLFNRPEYKVTQCQFDMLNKNRVRRDLVRAFGFVALKNAVAPAPNTTKQEYNQAKAMIEKLVKHG